jgi:hypothetical protein
VRGAPGTRESTLLLAILLVAAALRFSGHDWDAGTEAHPDERFLSGVVSRIRFPEGFRGSLRSYFDTAHSHLNPHNNGDRFFVYGTLPLFVVRALAEFLGRTDGGQITGVGRAASSGFDLASVLLVYLIGARLYGRRVGLLAAAFSALSVLPIQQAHFFVVDPFANTFILGGLYCTVRALGDDRWTHYALFGLCLGMACACKVSAAPLAGVIVLASVVRLLGHGESRSPLRAPSFVLRILLAALVSAIAFRVLQPYAFQPYGLALNPAWKANLAALARIASGETDYPPGMQWANRAPVWFSLENLVVRGLGPPLGALAWGAWGFALVRMLRGDWQRHLIPVAWTGAYFLIGSIGFVKTMRYQLPIYPTLAVLASWGCWQAWESARGRARWLVAAMGGAVFLATAAYAVAFALNYTRPFTRLEASAWIYRRVPAAVNVVMDVGGARQMEPIPISGIARLYPGSGLDFVFRARENASALSVLLPHVTADAMTGEGGLRAVLTGDDWRAEGGAAVTSGSEGPIELSLDPPRPIRKNELYRLRLESDAKTLVLLGSRIVTESIWDDALPFPMEGRSPFPWLYERSNQELYEPDGVDADGSGRSDKLERLVQTLTEGDYVVITSNRQYGSLGRLPQKYPLTVAYYRALFGCPADVEVAECAVDAAPGRTRGRLGYDLVAVFERNPSLGPLVFRDQLAEEAFTVYDHPKVLVFAKSAQFDPAAVSRELGAVDLSRAVNLPPARLGR